MHGMMGVLVLAIISKLQKLDESALYFDGGSLGACSPFTMLYWSDHHAQLAPSSPSRSTHLRLSLLSAPSTSPYPTWILPKISAPPLNSWAHRTSSASCSWSELSSCKQVRRGHRILKGRRCFKLKRRSDWRGRKRLVRHRRRRRKSRVLYRLRVVSIVISVAQVLRDYRTRLRPTRIPIKVHSTVDIAVADPRGASALSMMCVLTLSHHLRVGISDLGEQYEYLITISLCFTPTLRAMFCWAGALPMAFPLIPAFV